MNTFFAVIIILGVAIAITIAAVVWITTTYHSMIWRPEILKIIEIEMYRNTTDNSWWLYIKAENMGENKAEIYKLEIYGIEIKELKPPKTIDPGKIDEIYIKLDKEYIYGTMYTVKLYLKSGTVYPVLEKTIRV
ncbi:MAG: hypothetical protein QXX12_07740 [Nanopusillaceae archaeon]